MKKIFALALLLILTVAIAPSKSFANENNDFISSNPISIENYEANEEAIQSKTENSLNEWTPRKTYKLEASKIEKYDNHEFDGLLTYLSPPTNQSFFMLPVYGWVLNDSLKDLFAIRYFTHKFKDVYLWVDANNNVSNIQLTEKQE